MTICCNKLCSLCCNKVCWQEDSGLCSWVLLFDISETASSIFVSCIAETYYIRETVRAKIVLLIFTVEDPPEGPTELYQYEVD